MRSILQPSERAALDRGMRLESADRASEPPARWKDPAEAVVPVRCTTFFGRAMELILPDPVALSIQRYGFMEAGLTNMVLAYLRPGQCFYDVGAHAGYFTLLAARIAGAKPGAGSVHAFEPTPSTFAMLRRNCAEVPGVVLRNLAVWSRAERLRIHDCGERFSAFNSVARPRLPDEVLAWVQPTTVEVDAVCLDDYALECGRAPDFVKIDAESAEMQVLEGMEGLLGARPPSGTPRRRRPIITIETGDLDVPGAPASAELVRHLLARGYRALEFAGGVLREHGPRDRYGYDNILFLPEEL